jgi:hypothetical protein
MPNQYNFNILGNEVACIDCDVRDFVWHLPAKLQQKHFLEHNSSVVVDSDTTTVIVNHRVRQMACRKCGHSFEQERRRGRPYLECENCR